MKREKVEKKLAESYKRIYGNDKEVKVVVDIGNNTWEEKMEKLKNTNK